MLTATKSIINEMTERRKNTINEKVIAVGLSLLTTLIAGCFAFLWNLNAAITRIQDQQMQNAKAIDEINLKINNIQLDVRDLRERIIMIESKKPK